MPARLYNFMPEDQGISNEERERLIEIFTDFFDLPVYMINRKSVARSGLYHS